MNCCINIVYCFVYQMKFTEQEIYFPDENFCINEGRYGLSAMLCVCVQIWNFHPSVS
jgi:hypothetical protein